MLLLSSFRSIWLWFNSYSSIHFIISVHIHFFFYLCFSVLATAPAPARNFFVYYFCLWIIWYLHFLVYMVTVIRFVSKQWIDRLAKTIDVTTKPTALQIKTNYNCLCLCLSWVSLDASLLRCCCGTICEMSEWKEWKNGIAGKQAATQYFFDVNCDLSIKCAKKQHELKRFMSNIDETHCDENYDLPMWLLTYWVNSTFYVFFFFSLCSNSFRTVREMWPEWFKA